MKNLTGAAHYFMYREIRNCACPTANGFDGFKSSYYYSRNMDMWKWRI